MLMKAIKGILSVTDLKDDEFYINPRRVNSVHIVPTMNEGGKHIRLSLNLEEDTVKLLQDLTRRKGLKDLLNICLERRVMMITLKRYAYILELLKKMDVKVGKTFLQKAIYIIQEGLKEQLNYHYKLHFYGPFSQELANDIEALNDMGLIDVEFDPDGYGYNIRITDKGKQFLEKLRDQKIEVEKEKINKVLPLIEDENIKRMELLGTVLYFSRLTNDEEEIKKLINMVKPHFPNQEISEALKKLKDERIA